MEELKTLEDVKVWLDTHFWHPAHNEVQQEYELLTANQANCRILASMPKPSKRGLPFMMVVSFVDEGIARINHLIGS